MHLSIPAGTTSKIISFPVYDSSSSIGGMLTGLVYTTSGLTAYYNRIGAAGAATAITLATATKGTWATGGFVAVDGTNTPGWYELSIPDAALATSCQQLILVVKGAANMVQVNIEIELTAISNQDAVRGGMTALPNANAEAAGGLYTRGTGAGQINQPANGRVDVNAVAINQVATTSVAAINANQGTTQPVNFTGTGATAYVKTDETMILGTAIATPATAGILDVNVKNMNNVAATSITTINANQGTTQPVNYTGTGATAYVKTDIISAAGTAWGSSAITAGSIASNAITSSKLAANCITASQINTGAITNAKFAAGAIDAAAIADSAIDRATFAVDTGLQTIRSNTAQSVANGTITLDVSAKAVDNYYQGIGVLITGGTNGVGQRRTIASYVGSTKVATLDRNWDENPTGTITYALMGTDGDVIDFTATQKTSITTACTASTPVVASVTGNVNGSVASIAANGITATSIATDAINAASVKADAVTKIQNGLATPTNITAGTLTTVTNVTNAPSNGDFTATMKTSLNSATPSVTVSDKTGFSLSSAGVQSIWDALSSALVTVGSIGKRLVDYVTGVVALDSTVAKDATVSKPGTAQTITPPADMALNSTVAKEATLTTKIPTALSFTGANVNAESKVTAAPSDMALNSTVAKDATVSKPGTAQTITANQAVNAAQIGGQTVTAGGAITVLASVGTATTNTAQTGDSYAKINDASKGLVKVYDDMAKDATVSKPGTAQTITPPADMALNSTVAKATTALDNTVWTNTKAGYIDAAISSRGTGTALDAAGIRSAIGMSAADLDTQIDTLALDSTVAKDATVSKPGTAQTITANQAVNVAQWGGSNISTPAVTGQPVVTLGATQAAFTPARQSDLVPTAVVVDAVWDEALSGHSTAGTSGKALSDSGASADPWSIAIPGSYGVGTAGKILGDNINAPIGTIDTVVDAIKTQTDKMQFDVSNNIKSVKNATSAGTTDFNATEKASITTAATASTPTVSVGNVTLATSQPNYAPAKAGDAMTLTSAYDSAKTAASASSVSALGSPMQASSYVAPDNAGIAASEDILDKFDTMIEASGINYTYTSDALKNAPVDVELNPQDVRDAMYLSPSPGVPQTNSIDEKLNNLVPPTYANTIDILTKKADLTTIPLVKLVFKNDSGTVIQTVTTDIDGVGLTSLPDGTVDVFATLSGYTFPATTIVITDDTSIELVGTSIAIEPPAAGLQTVYFIPDDPSLLIDTNIVFTARVSCTNNFIDDSVVFTKKAVHAVNHTTYFSFELAKGGTFLVEGSGSGKLFYSKTITITDDDTRSLTDY